MKFDFLEELYVFNSKSNYVSKEMYEKARADIDRRGELLKEVIDKGNRGFSAMSHEYHWSIPTELKEMIEKELEGKK